MKPILIFLLLSGVISCLTACSDDGDKTEGLKLSADLTTIQANGADKVTFTATFNGEVVTGKTVVSDQASGEIVENAVFMTTVPGEYRFVAKYAGTTSDDLTVTAVKGEGFKKNILVMKFTATGCYTCPDAEHSIRKAQSEYPGKIYPMAIYGTIGTWKDFMVDEYVNAFLKQFSFSTYPWVILDHKDVWNHMNGTQSMVFDKALKAKGEVGIALSTKLEDRGLTIDVRIKGQKLINYSTSLVVVILENNLYAYQTGGKTEEDNIHNHVVRKFVTDLYGDEYKIAKETIGAGSEYSRSFNYTIPEEFRKENLDIMVYLLKTSDRSALNCQMVQIGKTIDYEAL